MVAHLASCRPQPVRRVSPLTVFIPRILDAQPAPLRFYERCAAASCRSFRLIIFSDYFSSFSSFSFYRSSCREFIERVEGKRGWLKLSGNYFRNRRFLINSSIYSLKRLLNKIFGGGYYRNRSYRDPRVSDKMIWRGEEGRGKRRIGGSSIQGEREGLMAQAGHSRAINRRTARNYRLATCEI